MSGSRWPPLLVARSLLRVLVLVLVLVLQTLAWWLGGLVLLVTGAVLRGGAGDILQRW